MTIKPQQPLEQFRKHNYSIAKLFKECGLKPNQVLKLVAQPDTHVDEHDVDALSVFMKFIDSYKPHVLVNLGDFLEMNAVAHWKPSDPAPRRLVPQIKTGKKILAEINAAAGKQCKKKIYIKGNHEDWLDQYLCFQIPEVLDGLETLGVDLTIDKLLGLDKLGYDFIPLNDIVQIGPSAHFIHGYYCGTHHAKKHLDVFGVNTYYGHLHDTQSHSAVNIRGLHEAMSLGCLRTLNAKFLKGKPNNWSHAFGIFEFRIDGSYTRIAPTIIEGAMSYNGKIFKA